MPLPHLSLTGSISKKSMKNKQSVTDGGKESIGVSPALQTVFLSQEKIEIIRISASKLENIIHKFFQKLLEKKPAGACLSTGVSMLLTWLPSGNFNGFMGIPGETIKNIFLILSILLIITSGILWLLSPSKKETSADSLFSRIKSACSIEEPCIGDSVSVPCNNQLSATSNTSGTSVSSYSQKTNIKKTRSMRKQPLPQEIEDYHS